MESELVKESIVHGRHIYIQRSTEACRIGELLRVLQESNNLHYTQSLGVFRDGKIVGHIPREF